LLWFLFLRTKLRYVLDKQAPGVLMQFFVAGTLSTVLTLALHEFYPIPLFVKWVYESEFAYEVLVTGVVEETAKFACFLFVAHALVTVREPQDGVLQGAAVGLGFATIENILYIYRYPQWFIAVRPLISSGGHMLYGAVWGGLYSAAMWSNAHSEDPGSWRLAAAGVGATALFHGLYNSVVVYGLMQGIAVKAVVLFFATMLFLRLQTRSPYRQYKLGQARMAVRSLRRGLVFNRKSPILNRRLGLYLIRLGEYKAAAEHLGRALPRSYDRLRTRFFFAVSCFAYLPEHHGRRALRRSWSRLPDSHRKKLMRQLERFLRDDTSLLYAVRSELSSAFTRRRGLHGRALARELKLRKAAQRSTLSPALARSVAELSSEEREMLRKRIVGRG
jgi:RsiW-degrading membrane proteinase PrsW (M82 family)